jgi:sarcosine oxidase subunit delta
MLRITCPYCGTRDESEFIFGGQSDLTRPSPTSDDKAWTGYLFNRENPQGVQLERWVHNSGCGRWFNVARDTKTHEIVTTYVMGLPPPGPNDA